MTSPTIQLTITALHRLAAEEGDVELMHTCSVALGCTDKTGNTRKLAIAKARRAAMRIARSRGLSENTKEF